MSRFVLSSGLVLTFAFWFPLDDPMNLPKMFFLLISSSWLLASLAAHYFYQRPKKHALGHLFLLVFVLAILLAAILTDVRYTAFFGGSHRNNGAFTYLGLAIVGLAAMVSFDLRNIFNLRTALLIVGAGSTLYGLFQTTGHDPFHWVHLYGPVVGTVGNPDFYSAVVGVSAIATIWYLLSKREMKIQISGSVLLLLELFIVKRSGSVQGMLAFAVGASLLLLVKIWQVQKRVGIVAMAFIILGGLIVFLGMLNKGPVASVIYRSSFQSRKDYWHAAIGMFKAHPLIGVGLERFAENYPHFAPQIQAVQGVNTDNAHSVIFQLLATGGLLVIVPYLLLLGLIFFVGQRAIRSSFAQNQIDITAIFSIWFSFFLISLISIDNLGVTIWFWITGGALYAVATKKPQIEALQKVAQKRKAVFKNVQQDYSNYLTPIVSVILLVIVLGVMVPVLRTSTALYQLSGNTKRLTQQQYVAQLEVVSKSFPRNPQTLIVLADLALRASDTKLALHFTSSILEKDPKSQLGNQLSASAYEINKNYKLALPYRLRNIELDPWNANNMLEIVKDYLVLKDLPKARSMVNRIVKLRPGTGIDVTATNLLKG